MSVMFTHMVLFRFPDDETAEAVVAKVHDLAAAIADVAELVIGRDEARQARSYDVGLLMRFTDRAAFERYCDHPLHVEAADWIDGVATEAVSVDWDDPAGT
jgi:hypothetical protein